MRTARSSRSGSGRRVPRFGRTQSQERSACESRAALSGREVDARPRRQREHLYETPVRISDERDPHSGLRQAGAEADVEGVAQQLRSWLDGLRWPWNYLVLFGLFVTIALASLVWALSATSERLAPWVIGAVLVGAGAGCFEAYWRMRTRGELLVLGASAIRAEQARPRSYALVTSVGWAGVILFAFIRELRPIAFGADGAFLTVVAATRLISGIRHREQLRLLTFERQHGNRPD